ncbi:MAG: hypothetical protein ACXWOV_03190 [Isosphaeraceae bacterium]
MTQFVELGVAITIGSMRPEVSGELFDPDFLATHAHGRSKALLRADLAAEPPLDVLLGLLRPPRRKHLRESLPVGLGLNGTRAEELVKVLRPNLLIEPFLNLLIGLPGRPLREHPQEPLLIDVALGIEHSREPCPFVSCPDIHARRGDRLFSLGSAIFLDAREF